MESLFFFVIAVALAYAVGCWGSTRKIGFKVMTKIRIR